MINTPMNVLITEPLPPVHHTYGKPVPSDDLAEGIETPDYAIHYERPETVSQ